MARGTGQALLTVFLLGCPQQISVVWGDGGSPDSGAGDGGTMESDASSPADASNLPDASSAPDGSNPADASGNTGPGPYGALPSGYCCTSNNDCRTRSCLAVNGTTMCSDECNSDSACQGIFQGFACADAGVTGQCLPTSSTTNCVPANQYTLGTKTLGQCCTATHDATAGLECLGGRCDAFGDLSNPYILRSGLQLCGGLPRGVRLFAGEHVQRVRASGCRTNRRHLFV